MGLGFELAESVNGSFHRFDRPFDDHSLRMKLRLGVDGLRRFARDRRIDVEGYLFAAGLAENGGVGHAVAGTITWKLLEQNRVVYTLDFLGDDGRTYHLRGQRDFFLHDALLSMTTMAASLYDDGEVEIGRAMLHFEPKMELLSLLKSFRPRLRLGRGRGRPPTV